MILGRRSFIITGAAAAADFGAGGGSAWAAETPIRYPDPNIKVLDPRFQPYVLNNAAIDRIVKWEEETGAISVFRRPAHYANGNTRDRQGRLITCEMDAQRLTRTEYDGTITVLADRFEGKRLTAPNDVVVKSDGAIWFSDNGAGTRGNYLGHKAPWDLPFRVYRLDPATGALTMAIDDMKRPNGLAFSPDETRLYVVDTPGPGQRTVQVYDVVDHGTKVANRREFCSAEPGGSDGLRVDTDGNLWCAWSGGEAEDGVAVYAPDGTMIGRILLPERCANVCFGGPKRNRLFMAASQSIYALYVETQGVLGG
jgi:gluconolactonase